MEESTIVLLSVPVYALVIGFEIIYSQRHHLKLYTRKGIMANLYLTSLNMGLDLLVRGVCLVVLGFFFSHRVNTFAVSPLVYWTLLVIAEDFMYYWLHRVDHYCRFFWAVHVTHHSSEEFNLTVGFRSSVFQPLYRFIYFVPLAFAGFRPIDIMLVYSVTQIFGILIHTQTIGKLGILEYILVTPSHHRVHHASNTRYLDKNMGMLLIIWDRLFGTFEAEAEQEPIKYGLTTNINTHHPFVMVFHEWKNIFSDVFAKGLTPKERLLYLFGPPGWSHDGSRKTSAQLRAELTGNEDSECLTTALKG
jgi:sterol desaturase/sphingolipid hydroxylase (fatty acid hydroxylase superfamily)